MPSWAIALLKGFLKFFALPVLEKIVTIVASRKDTAENGKPKGDVEQSIEEKIHQDGFK